MSSFVARHRSDWEELERLLDRARRSLSSLSPDELQRLDVLYRRTTIHLAQASTRTHDQRLIESLNQLTAAAHSLIYLPPRRSLLAGGLTFLTEGFARSIARNGRAHGLSALLLAAGMLLAYYLSMTDTQTAYALSMAGDPRQPGASREQLLEILRHGRDEGGGTKFAFASFLFQHNFKVGLAAMSLGLLAAVPTVLLMLYNGMILGSFVAVHTRAGVAVEMWAWILPHGVTELGAIVLCGGVGLMLGRAILTPGMLSRGEALRRAGREAGRTCGGVFFMLLAAAVIESYLRQSHLSTSARLTFAAASALFWASYIAYGFVRERASVSAPGVSTTDSEFAERLSAE